MGTQNTQVPQQSSADDKPSLLKQLIGAGAGMMVALALYNAYEFASPYAMPYVHASIAYIYPPGTSVTNPPSSEVRFSDKSISSDSPQFVKIGARAREIANRLGPAGEAASSEMTETAVEETVSPESVMEEAASSSEEGMPAAEEEETTIGASVLEEASSSSAEETAAIHAGAPKLPSSGIGMWMAVIMALGGAVMMVPRVRKWILEQA